MTGAWQRLRARAADDAGISLIETLVAGFILTVGLLALLGVLTTSLRVTGQQRAHTVATRVVTQHLEELRGVGYDDLAEGSTTGTVTQDGITYTVTTTTTTLDPKTGDEAEEDEEGVRRVVADVTWAYQGNERTTSFQTVVAPRNDLSSGVPLNSDAQQIAQTDMRPTPTVVDEDGHPTQDIGLTAVLRGFSDTAIVTVSWDNDGGPAAPVSLTSADGGITWTGTINRSSITRVVEPEEDGSVGRSELEAVFRAQSGSDTLTRVHTLALQSLSGSESPPQIIGGTASVNPTTIRLEPPHNQHGCDHNSSCRNRDALRFTVHVRNVTGTDSLRLKYQLYDGTFQELAMRLDSQPDSNGVSRWSVDVQRRSVKFKAGNNQPFTFQVTRQSDGASDSYVFPVNVQVTN